MTVRPIPTTTTTAGHETPATGPQPFYGRPFLWLVFALVLLAVPAAGAMWKAGLGWSRIHPAINAMLNGSSAVFLIAGFAAIRNRRVALHRSCMVAAVTISSVFLASYLVRFATTGAHRYAGHGWDRSLYLFILFSHMVLATVAVPLVIRAVFLARRRRFAAHRRVARWLWPIWIYVSVTGVAVYLMLYHLGG